MSKVLLIDVDSKIPNIALMKISRYHKNQGDKVGFNVKNPDIIYVSIIFPKNKYRAEQISWMYPDARIMFGGTGYDPKIKLLDEIEILKPDYDLYPDQEYSIGFTTRGCIRKCKFCFVPEKEGKLKIAQHPKDFHDSRFRACKILDNNILASPEYWWKSVFQWFIDNDITIMEGGMDIRLLTLEKAKYLRKMKFKIDYKFAWDNMEDEKYVVKGIKILQDAGIDTRQQIRFYVLSGFNTTFEQDLYRCNKLKELGSNPFVMVYNFDKSNKKLNDLQRWANNMALFRSMKFEEYNTSKRYKVMDYEGKMYSLEEFY
jgi:hypothetical protein